MGSGTRHQSQTQRPTLAPTPTRPPELMSHATPPVTLPGTPTLPPELPSQATPKLPHTQATPSTEHENEKLIQIKFLGGRSRISLLARPKSNEVSKNLLFKK